jgi:hypothetical protein
MSKCSVNVRTICGLAAVPQSSPRVRHAQKTCSATAPVLALGAGAGLSDHQRFLHRLKALKNRLQEPPDCRDLALIEALREL